MEIILNQLITNIVNNNPHLLSIAIHQRAKFEGWLKFELAYELKYHRNFTDTLVEYYIDKKLVDIYSNRCFIELKTPNTNYTHPLCLKATRPIKDNIDSILKDIDKLNTQNQNNGYIAFVLFPLDNQLVEYKKHTTKITDKITSLNSSFHPVETILNVNGVNILIYTSRVI